MAAHESDANDRRDERLRDMRIGTAAWAHYRWPWVGIIAGAGVGVILGFLFFTRWGWLTTAGVTGGLALAGCFLGWLAAVIVYPMR